MQQHSKLALSLTGVILSSFAFLSTAHGQSTKTPAKPILERIEWTDIWVTNANADNELPRVLFVGDSITRGYFGRTEKNIGAKANCARYTTSAFISNPDYLAELKILLKRYHFDVIHINNGLHGWDYTEQQYRDGFPALIQLLKQYAPDATIIWATTTPVRVRGNVQQLKQDSTERVRMRNKIALEFAKKNHFLVSDLFALVIDHPEYYNNGGVHFNAKGIAAQAKYIADIVSKALAARKK